MSTASLESLNTTKANEIAAVLRVHITPSMKAMALRTAECTVPLRRLYDVHKPAYDAAFQVWLAEAVEFCHALDRSGISAAVVEFARDELQCFSFVDNGPAILQSLGLSRFLSAWEVPAAKYERFWPYVDQSVARLRMPGVGRAPFEIEPILKRVFAIHDLPGVFDEWEHLRFNWKTFFSYVAITAGCASATTGVGLAGIAVGAAGLAAQ